MPKLPRSRPSSATGNPYDAGGTTDPDSKCPWCPYTGRQGLGAHKRFCKNKPAEAQDLRIQAAFDALVAQETQARAAAIEAALQPGNLNLNRGLRGGDDSVVASNNQSDDELVDQPVDDNNDTDIQSIDNPLSDEGEESDVDEGEESDVVSDNSLGAEGSDDSEGEESDPDDNIEGIDFMVIDSASSVVDRGYPLSATPAPGDRVPELYDIMVQTHPSRGSADSIYSFEDYYADDDPSTGLTTLTSESVDRVPWRAFRTRLNFELAEVMQSAHLNRREIDTIISIIKRAIDEPNSFTLEGYTDLTAAWTAARHTHAEGFKVKTVSVPYNDETLEFQVHVRPIWLWCRELLLDPNLIKEFRWDAERIFKFNGEVFERFIDEPWTADAWWEYQSQANIPDGASPFFIILYADKTRLSSFGTEKGYPVLVRCANLPIEIRNSTGPGGGRLVGWLPIAADTPSEKNKKEHINMKRVLWHKSMEEIIKTIQTASTLGVTLECGDGITRTIFPHILMLSADYEEQVMMALTRGVKSLKPCPICLIDKKKMSRIPDGSPLRTNDTMRDVYQDAQNLSAKDKEEVLMSYGLRDTENIFWSLGNNMDVYSALSFDVLHAYDAGLFKTHLLKEVKDRISELGTNAQGQVEVALSEIPPWPGLNHFTSLSTGEMADGTKFEDLSKVIVFATLHILTPFSDEKQAGYVLLRLIRSYLELRMYASLTVHTESTIRRGEAELARFGQILKKYQKVTPNTTKSWNFPKIHTHTHMFRDILRKGATRNYNTKPNEKANGPLKKYYQFRTNFKEVAGQILKVNEMDITSTIIRSKIDVLDEVNAASISPTTDDAEAMDSTSHTVAGLGAATRRIVVNDYVELGSPLSSLSILEVEEAHAADPLFTQFRRKLNHYFSQLLNKRLVFDELDIITPYQYIKVFYRSVVDINVEQNILRTNPNFFKKERFDCALIRVEDKKAIFGRLQFLFAIKVEGKQYYMALIRPMDMPRAPRTDDRARDQNLRLTRVRPRAPRLSVLVDVDTIIRGGLLVKDNGSNAPEGEFLVNTFIDQDMWMRLWPENTELVVNAKI